MTSDVRDVVFQASPFDDLDSSKLHVFEEAGIYFGAPTKENRPLAKKIYAIIESFQFNPPRANS
ncbi:hypothetical protein [Microcoleus sp. AT3-D2]|uniref:hypothetical protein n=1 Tax=Microcoleus sp. AT3-D2 TaxID=2818612 RepID=UPI002FCE78CE